LQNKEIETRINSMKKIFFTFLIIVILIGGYGFYKNEKAKVAIIAPVTPIPQNPSNTGSTMSATNGYKDGSYTGNTIDATYGQVQVSAIIRNGRITDVQFLQYPNDPGHTQEVNQLAMPLLKQEAITAQNANVAIVSSATQTSNAFIQSLQSALDQAKS
jgi:uncharacterized protein with FMN-binding domain